MQEHVFIKIERQSGMGFLGEPTPEKLAHAMWECTQATLARVLQSRYSNE